MIQEVQFELQVNIWKHCFWESPNAFVPIMSGSIQHFTGTIIKLQSVVCLVWNIETQRAFLCLKSHQVLCVKWLHVLFLCLHIIYTSGPGWHIWGFLPRCLSERGKKNTLLIGRLNSSRSACSTALSVDYRGNITPVECLPSPPPPSTGSQSTLRSKDCVLASDSSCHYISYCTRCWAWRLCHLPISWYAWERN